MCTCGGYAANRFARTAQNGEGAATETEQLRRELADTRAQLDKERRRRSYVERPLAQFVPPTNTTFVASGYSLSTNFTAKCDTVNVADSEKPITLLVVSRAVDNGSIGALYFRPITISPDGRIVAIGEEVDAMGVYANHE